MRQEIESGDWVSNTPFREKFLRTGMTASELARQLGMTRTIANHHQAQRALGLKRDHPARGRRSAYRQHVTREMAHRLADALNMDPHEWE